MRRCALFLSLLAAVCLCAAPDPADDVIFNEIMYNPGAGPVSDPENQALEYLELYNRGTVAVDLSGWSFTSGIQFTFPEGVVIQPNQYLVLAKDPQRITSQYGILNVLGPFVLRLDDGGEELVLRLPPVPPATEGVSIEDVRYDDEHPWPPNADGTGAPLERINPFWTNDAPGNWAAGGTGGWTRVSFSGNATSSRLYIYMSGAGEALIDEVEIRPAGGGASQIVNGGFEDATRAPWEVTGNHGTSYVDTTQAHSGSKCLHLVATGAGGSSSNSLNCYASPTLTDGQPYVVSAWVRFLSGNQEMTFRLSGSGIQGTAHPGVGGTPGSVNSVYSLDTAPSIENPFVSGFPGDPGNPTDPGTPRNPDHPVFVFHEPAMPTASQSVQFVALVKDDNNAIAEVTLNYNDGTDKTATMYDDGAHGDRYAGDRVYGVSLPAKAAWTIVSYYFTARDATNHTGRFPRIGGDTQRGGYMVYPTTTTQVPIHFVFIAPTDLTRLNTTPDSDTIVPATIVYNGEVWDNANASYRGQTSIGFTKHHWKFKFEKDHRFSGYPQELLDVFNRVNNTEALLGTRIRTINLNSSWGDKTYMREYLAYEQFRLAGLRVVPGTGGQPDKVYPGPANYVTWVTIYLNQTYWGLHTYVEQVNEDFLNRNGFDENGALFKSYTGGQSASQASGFSQTTGPVPEAMSELSTYLGQINTLSGAAETTYINNNMDPPTFIEYLLANTVVHNADQCGKNYYVYLDYYGTKKIWHMFPWDMDLTMGRNYECCGSPASGVLNDYIRWDYWRNPLIICTQQYPKNDGPWTGIINGFWARTTAFQNPYYLRLAEHIDAYYRQADLFAEIEFLRSKLRADAAADLVKWPAGTSPSWGSRNFDTHVDEMKRFIQNRIPAMKNALVSVYAPPIENLVCTYRSATQDVLMTWTIPGRTYDSIRVYRDGSLVATLAGNVTQTTAAAPAGKDYYVYRVASVYQGTEHEGQTCLVVIGGGDWVQIVGEDFNPAPSATWQLNGSAGFLNGELQTAPATGNQVGTAFFKTQVPSASFRANFDFHIDGDPAGADGLTFMWIRNSTAAGATGGAGHLMGFWGGNIEGYCVEFDTWSNPDLGDPSENHVGLNDSRTADMNHLAAAAVATNFEGTGVFHVEVTCLDGFVTVELSNASQGYGPATVIAHQIPNYIAGSCFFGFSGVTGGAVNDHRIDNFILEIPSTTPDPPVPDFSATPLTGPLPLSVAFTNLTTGDVTSFSWDFGDSEASTLENPSHVYTAAGTFTVRLTATGPGGTRFKERVNYITVTQPQGPLSDFYAQPMTGKAPLDVQFFAAATGEVTSFLWTFGDGTTSNEENPAHIYTRPAFYTVSLQVTGPGGTDTATKPQFIEVQPPAAPTVRFSAAPLSGKAPLAVTFTNETTGVVDSWLWEFGTGAVSPDRDPVYTYRSPGTYTVKLTAYYGEGLSVQFVEDDLIVATPDGATFVRGNVNKDGDINIADAVKILSYLFAHATVPCVDACDANDDSSVNIADAIYMLSYLFAKGPDPKPPFPTEGTDPTTDDLTCDS